MSLKNLANTMSAQGRGPDSVLVHMSPKELNGLQGLAMAAGGSLTVNPTTGLPEAGFLDSLLPTILGFGASMIGGPWMGAAAGALTGAAQNKNNPLMGALAGGLGGYGAGQFAQGLTSLAAPAEAAALTTPAAQGASMFTAPANAVMSGAQNAMSNPSALAGVMGGGKGLMQAGMMAAAPAAMAPVPQSSESESPELPKYRMSREYTGGLRLPGSGYTSERQYYTSPTFERVYAEGGDVAAEPDVARGMTGASADAFRYLMGKAPSSGAPQQAVAPRSLADVRAAQQAAAAPAAASTTRASETVPQASSYTPQASSYTPQSGGQGVNNSLANAGLAAMAYPTLAPGGVAINAAGNYIAGQQADAMGRAGDLLASTPVSSGMGTYSDKNGNVLTYSNPDTIAAADRAMFDGEGYASNRSSYSPSSSIGSVGNATTMSPGGGYFAEGGAVAMESGGFVVPADVVSALGNGSSSAGLEHLAAKMGARPIDGRGDGQSDSIPATVDGQYRAAVARDEAYIPPQIVKQLGGAKKLYAMMDSIRKQAHGDTRQQRPVV